MKLHSVVDNITNSSGTTFIVAFDKIPETIDEMQELLFSDDQKFIEIYGIKCSVEVIAKRILNDIQNQEEIQTSKQFYDCLDEDNGKYKEWWNRYRDSHIFCLYYYDEEDDGISLQNENIFSKIPYIVVF